MHWLRSLPHCLLGRRAPMHPPRPRDRPNRRPCGVAPHPGHARGRQPCLHHRYASQPPRTSQGPNGTRSIRDTVGTNSARGRNRVCRLQPLLLRLPSRQLHHNGRSTDWTSPRNLGRTHSNLIKWVPHPRRVLVFPARVGSPIFAGDQSWPHSSKTAQSLTPTPLSK